MNEHKQTPIGKIPEDWEVAKLGNKISLEYGKGLTETQRKKGKYPVFGSNGVVGYHIDFLVKRPGIVVGRKGTIGAISWTDNDFWPIDTTYFVVLKDNSTDLSWMYYKLSSLNLSKLNMATGTPGLNRDIAYGQVISIPSKPEQKKIAEILSTVDEGIEKTEQAIEKTERLKKGLMQKLLTRGISHKEFKDTEIGRIPASWKVVKVGQIANLINGRAFKPTEWSDAGLPIIRIQNLNDLSKPFNYCNFEVAEKYIINKEEILLAWSGTPGTSFGVHKWMGRKAVLNQHIFKVIFKAPDLFKNYFIAAINQRLDFLIKKAHGGAGLKHVTKSVVNMMLISLPTLFEQKKIAEILGTVDNRLELLRKKKEKLERVKKGLMNDLLTGQKRVKVGAQDGF
ncbi:restriction endonuclease subunit S [Candidatus Oleimmundimicrobium sp.]|uniref:restriction endonuclease subunit S n=1 Tax=Candidatus Oleimmundimicrobium sp. TaxID=3060597 RepID=UPI002728E2B4|nr:restriction endonuclease subunit S [Candidatus Oleimmundimicrobium sp.]MDO8885965.1 restriction endonuclease subunit S [Candidatus Oleimmundimicrobium sp.]